MGTVIPEFRSRLEARVWSALPRGTQYEPDRFRFPVADPGRRCRGCGSKEIERTTSYTPDFKLPNGTYIESKGIFTGGNRRNLLAFRAAHPDVKVRLLFQADNTFNKKSTTRYSDWAKKAGFEFCIGINNIDPRWTK